MEYLESPPSAEFGSIVRIYWAIRADRGPAQEFEPVMPDGCPEVVFNCADSFERKHSLSTELQPKTLISGQIVRAIHIRPTGAVDLFGVRFQPWGAQAFLGIPMHTLTGSVAGLSPVDRVLTGVLEDKIADADGFAERKLVFEDVLRRQLSRNGVESVLPRAAACAIASSKGTLSVRRLAVDLGVSERRLQRAFRETVGLSPKAYSRIVRFQKMLRHLNDQRAGDILDKAFSLGYYDQSHLIRDFKDISGFTPGTSRDSGGGLSKLFLGVN